MTVYGKEFAAVYNLKWNDFTERTWPFLIRMVRLYAPKACNWLDLCCGTGALLKRAAACGYGTAGMDNSPHQLRFARKNAPEAKLFCQDVRSLAVGIRFDIITCMYDSLNYLLEPEDLQNAFTRIKSSLNTQSVFIFDMNTYEGLKDHWNRTFPVKFNRGVAVVDSSFKADKSLGRCRISGVLQDGGNLRRFREEHWERGYNADQIQSRLDKTGFQYIAYDGDRLSSPGMRPSRLLYICRLK